MSLTVEDVFTFILNDNIKLKFDKYINLNVFDSNNQVRSVCIGEIKCLQTDTAAEDAMSDSSFPSELSSDINA
ncbi:LEF-10 [Operophtera brumata nucleopolyhedrovirus]|uniref:LEF-10 n=1 Tax=Operophtera brumata nucleopolyhedrovirus TaxID=1046267 RepID=A0A2H4UZT7_9ABAC|nr:LEF-10 [Operophtera brumata nucleopolyhedrovirus]AUA60275.1 LEF-10 [Operophtera brumata nucleopolyhedrovirus]